MDHFHYNLIRVRDRVYLHILSMPEEFRNKFAFNATNGLKVMSIESPMLCDGGSMCLWGSSTNKDSAVALISLGGIPEAKEYYAKTAVALADAQAEMKRRQGTQEEEESFDVTAM